MIARSLWRVYQSEPGTVRFSLEYTTDDSMQTLLEKNTIAMIIFPKDQTKNTELTEIDNDLGPLAILC